MPPQINYKKIAQIFSKFAVFLIISLTAAVFVYSIGYENGSQNPKTLTIEGVSKIEDGKSTSADFSNFWKSWSILKDKYVESENLKEQDMIYGAISGLLSSTKDPYTVFMPPKNAQSFNEEISGAFGGIGAEIGVKNEQLTIVAPLKGTPAEKAGLLAGDAILKINNEDSFGLTTEDAVLKIRGEIGTEVTLLIFRSGWQEPKEFKITRDNIIVPTLDWKMLDADGKENKNGKILYIELHNFYEKAPLEFYEAILGSILNDPQGIILDLRNNPGGYLEAAVNISGWFVDRNAPVVIEKFKNGATETITSKGNPFLKDVPTILLINQGSASASEILAGALKDNNGIKLVGEKTFGKGSVQDLTVLPDGSQLKITIAHWLTPKGTLIDKNGLEPDYKVELTEENTIEGKDPQLGKAVELLKEQIK